MDLIKVSANSRTSAVAGAIAGVVREHKQAEVQAIGAGAVNQAVKALVLAIGFGLMRSPESHPASARVRGQCWGKGRKWPASAILKRPALRSIITSQATYKPHGLDARCRG